MRQRLVAFLAVFIGAVPLVLSAQQKSIDALKLQSDISSTTKFKPRVLKQEPVRVVLKMSADPVAVVRARSATHEITADEESATVATAHAQHVAAEPYIVAAGGKVLNHFHHAINGVKVEIAPDQLSQLASVPGVVAVMPVGRYELNNAISVPFIGAPQAWSQVPGVRGEGMKIAILDTGVDYTHANFGGPGTVAAWNAAFATSTLPADPTLFGPNAPKVKGGTDLVGDNYDPTSSDPAKNTPMPDPNPLDCNGHGSHVSGTATGFGVLASGSTYTGPYNSDAYNNNSFLIGPGVAPKADLYMVRLFGCSGPTEVVTEGIDWAVQHKMDVISMSLGSNFGQRTFADAEAAANAAKAGILVVAASGNAGPGLYITSAPASGDGVISAAAMDSRPTFPGAKLGLSSGSTITVINANKAAFTDGTNYPIVVLYNTPGNPASGISLGCNPNEYSAATGGTDVTGKLVVSVRGSCARVFRAGAAQHFGGIGAAMINNQPGYPPFEGNIPGGAHDPNSGNIYEPVHIPFFGVLQTDGPALAGATATTASNTSIANPAFERVAGFSSGGPLQGTSDIKPSLAAPGVSVISTGMGTGTQGVAISGTSMATPHIAGAAALTRQAHPRWSSQDQRAAILQTGDTGLLKNPQIRLAGAGVVQPFAAVNTEAVVHASDAHMNPLSFGEAEMSRDFAGNRELNITNHGNSPITLNLSSRQLSGGPASVTFDRSSVTVAPHEDESVNVTLNVPTSSVGPTHDPVTGALLFQEVSGLVTLAPADASQNNGVSLRLPYYLVPRVRSNVEASGGESLGPDHTSTTLTFTNAHGATAGTTDFYSLGNFGARSGIEFFDPRAVGVQSFPRTATDNFLVFALNTWTRFNNPAVNEADICIFTVSPPGPCDAPGVTPDFVVIGIGGGFLTSLLPLDRMVAAVFNPKTGAIVVRFFADAPTDGSTVLLRVRASDLGITRAAPTFAYTTAAFNETGAGAGLPGTGVFNAFRPPFRVDSSPVVPPNGTAQATVTVDPTQWALTPPAGLMIVVPDNHAGQRQAQIIGRDE